MYKKLQRLLALAGALMMMLAVLPAGATDTPVHVHAYTDWAIVTRPGCLTEGLEQRFCTAPGCPSDTQKETRTILPTGHNWDSWNPTKWPTCTEDGVEQRMCRDSNRCGIAPQTRALPKLGHNWSAWQVTKPATCLAEGSQESICLNLCGIAPQTQPIPKLTHQWSAWTSTKAPTCTEKGIESRTCPLCNSKEDRDVAALTHNYVWTVTTAPTCSKEGSRKGVCSRDATHTTTETIAALGKNQTEGHTFGAWTTASPGDCLHDGSEQRTCSACGRVETRNTGKGPHKVRPNWYALRQPTLERIGQKVRYCDICDKIVERRDMTREGYMYGLIARNFGPYVKDLREDMATLKDRFTPLVFSQEGETAYPIVTDDGYYVGQVRLNVLSDTLTVTYQMNDPATVVDKTTEMLFLFKDMHEATTAQLTGIVSPYRFGEVIPLNGQTSGVVDVRLSVNYDRNHTANRPFPDNGTYLDGVTNNGVILQEMTVALTQAGAL